MMPVPRLLAPLGEQIPILSSDDSPEFGILELPGIESSYADAVQAVVSEPGTYVP